MRCYCSICRKTQGGGGYAINLRADTADLVIEGEEHIRIYRARVRDRKTGEWKTSGAERRFCGTCSSGLWVYSDKYPEMIHPFASAVDTPLPVPPERFHILLNSKADWAEPEATDRDVQFDTGPGESLADWHERHGLVYTQGLIYELRLRHNPPACVKLVMEGKS